MFLIAYLEKGPAGPGVSASRVTREQSLGYTKHGSPESSASSGRIPILVIPACGMYHKTTIFDLILPMVLSEELIGRRELAELGHGGLCLNCEECRYPVCPFGK
jgi:hypothetical protein